MSLENIQGQIDALNLYEETLSKLRERGLSESLMSEVLGMDLDEAVAYGGKLIEMTDGQWDEYNRLWEEKQKRAAEIAANFYQDQLNALKTEYSDKLGETLGELTDTAFVSGQDTVRGLIDGLAEEESELYAKAQEIAAEMSRILGGDITDNLIPSNREITAQLSLQNAVANTSADVQKEAKGGGNAMPAKIEVTLDLDGQTLARKTFSYNQRENNLRGESLVEVPG